MNVKIGDIAITTWSKIPGNEGRIVEVIRWHSNDPVYGPRWWIRSVGSPMRNCESKDRLEGHFPDQYLRPVSGLPIEKDTNIEERVPA